MGLVKPKKFLGQHFLRDLGIANDIADTVDTCPTLPILEVGPGMGVLTQFLLNKNREVKVVELDFESVAYLKENFADLKENIIEDDFLKLKLENIFNGKPFVLTGNYPYNISSQIFFKRANIIQSRSWVNITTIKQSMNTKFFNSVFVSLSNHSF